MKPQKEMFLTAIISMAESLKQLVELNTKSYELLKQRTDQLDKIKELRDFYANLDNVESKDGVIMVHHPSHEPLEQETSNDEI